MEKNNTIDAFFAILRAGLWERDVSLSEFGKIDYDTILQLAEEQAVVGIITAGFKHVKDVIPPQDFFLKLLGQTLLIEQRNKGMNLFIGNIVERMRENGIRSILLKGQGVAQCYERPLWRLSGDIDLFFDDSNYNSAKKLLLPLATNVEKEYAYSKHLGLTIDGWEVELHGTLHCELWKGIDDVLNEVQSGAFDSRDDRIWMNGYTQIPLLRADEDVVYIFSHIFQHFFKGGMGLRQVCDWCRLLWVYMEKLSHKLLVSWIRKAGLMSEWKALGAFAVEYLGMPVEAMPLYSPETKWKQKAAKILVNLIRSGNMGHNMDPSFRNDLCFLKRKILRLGYVTVYAMRNGSIFPADSIKVWWNEIKSGLRTLLMKEW